MNATDIVALLSGKRFRLATEKLTQADIEQCFKVNGVKFIREMRLSPSDIPDFICGSVAIEVKVRNASKLAIFRQLERYAQHDAVDSIILVTNVPTGMPETINGKPVHVFNLGKAWL